MIVTASGMAFAHGSNDVANAIGPVSAIVGVVTTGEVAHESTVSNLGPADRRPRYCHWAGNIG